MEERKQELKALKKGYKQAKRRIVTLWKTFAIITLVLSLILVPASIVMSVFDNTVAAFVGGSFWELVNEDSNANYFTMDFASNEEMYRYGNEICYQVEAEGAALLLNNGALPLKAGDKVSTLSSSAVNLVYGGTGSGNVDASKADDFKTALEKSGFVVNPTLWDFYLNGAGSQYNRDASAGESAVLAGQASIAEVPMDVYPQDVKDSIASYGDAVIIPISRVGGEGYDLAFKEYNYLALDKNEKHMLDYAAQLKSEGKVKKIIVLLNTSNALQVDFLKENPYAIDACLWIGGVGIAGTNAVTDILAGKVTPSGSLVDTYCYDNMSSPAMQNFVPTTYKGYDGKNVPKNASTYMIYQEGIYVGYKYYETRYEDFVMNTAKTGNFRYGDEVAYPFGYGLSYTDFAFSNMGVQYDESKDRFEVTVTVTNTGDTYSGKKTVQVYFQSPYTDYDRQNGVEKASVALCGFAKTGVLAPGQSETVKVYVDKRDLASYDAYGAGTYILDAGDYYLSVGHNAHDALNNILSAKGYTPENTDGRMDAAGNAELSYKWTQQSFDAVTYSKSLNGTPITNKLSSADINLYDGSEQKVTYLSRSDWEGTFPKQIVVLELTDTMIRELQDVQYNPANYPSVQMPTLGAKNGLKLYDMIGLDFDDPKWQQLLDQLTFEEMVSMIGDSFHWRMPAVSVHAPGARDENGPQGLTAALFGAGLGDVEPTAFTSEDVMAATFNVALMYEVGKVIGNNCLAADVVCLYGPGSNTHRTPYGGRNFEYYSEDGFLAGEIGAAEIQAIQDKGIDVVIKHFALNDCEQERIGQAVWLSEQAAREIYLKAFQKPLEEANANGVMTAYTRWGTIWSGGYKPLMTGIMRQEWGNQGMSITDNVLTTYVNGVDGILAGTTTFDAMLPHVVNQLPKYENDPVIVAAMRNACHHNLYAMANSSGMNGVGKDTTVKLTQPGILTTVFVATAVIAVIFVGATAMWIVSSRKLKRTEAYLNYRTMKMALKDEHKNK